MTHASLFSGIGGFDLAAEWAGWTNAFNCEIDPFCRTILKYHFPNAKQYEDIRTADFTIWKDRIDVLTGGFPCQPFSLAGKRQGTEDDRYLWPAMLDVIRTVRPRWVVGENVYGIVNWSEGLVFEQVCADLEAAGYEVQPYIIPACGVGAPHRRDRCWFVAHRADAGTETMRERSNGVHADSIASDTPCLGRITRRSKSNRTIQNEKIGSNIYVPVERSGSKRTFTDPDGDRRRKRPNEQKPLPECVGTSDAGNGVENGIVAYSDRQRCEECNASCQSGHTQRTTQNSDAKRRIPDWNGFPTQPPVCGGDDGFPGELAGIAFPRWRREAVKACGNAIVPQVALQIFETINEYERK